MVSSTPHSRAPGYQPRVLHPRMGLMRIFVALALLFGCAQHARHGHGAHGSRHGPRHGHRSFEDAERCARQFDDPRRDAWQKPEVVIASLHLTPDAKVADVGAGTGYFALRLARRLPSGLVYAVDLEPSMLLHVEERARAEGLSNVRTVLASPVDPRLPEPVDVVLLVNTYHHLEQRPEYLRRLRPSLRQGGRVVVVDFYPESERGPPRADKVSLERLRDEAEAAGFVLTATERLPEQYIAILSPGAR